MSVPQVSVAAELVSGEGSPAIEIFYPRDNSLFVNELTHLVAKVAGDKVAYAVIRVNEQITPVVDLSDEAYREVLGETLIVRLYLLPGENEVEVTLKDKEGQVVEVRKLKLYYRDAFGNDTSSIPAGYAKRPLHVPGSGEYCKGCHRMEVDPVVDMEPEKKYDLPCVKCHEAGLLLGSPHGTVTWRCLACHKTEGAQLYSVKDDEGKFCLDCHSDEVDRLKGMESVHTNVKGVKCRSCHRLHNTLEAGLVPVPVNKLCYDCHKKVYSGSHITPGHPLEARKDPTREGRAFSCTSCHDPHASSMKWLLKFEPGMTMCKNCHSK